MASWPSTAIRRRTRERVGFSVVDAAAAYCLSQGILAALLKQARTGVCEDVVVSLLDVAIHLQGTVWNEYQQTDIVPERSGNGQPNSGAGCGPGPCEGR